MSKTTWEGVSGWYDQIVAAEGHFYHKELILPVLLPLLKEKDAAVLDLGCGQGILERQIPKDIDYLGIDGAKSLIVAAQKRAGSKCHLFQVGDLTKPLKIEKKFTHCVFLLSIQNMADMPAAINNARKGLKKGGKLILVINHPSFRIPRQSSWSVDEKKKMQFRRIDSYMSEMEIPIQQKPSKGKKSVVTYSYHLPLSKIVDHLVGAGFVITGLQELCSPKKSTGGKSRMENRARKEFPLFMLIEAR
ncbi:MAG: methyltransferase domain-containing protein [Candidatus Algichlamydia australiensis]|nr:methyltransferase domain-containing protein [Chlamydiales bacterium]